MLGRCVIPVASCKVQGQAQKGSHPRTEHKVPKVCLGQDLNMSPSPSIMLNFHLTLDTWTLFSCSVISKAMFHLTGIEHLSELRSLHAETLRFSLKETLC